MDNDFSIQVSNVTKKYALYPAPSYRIREVFSPTKKSYHKDFYALRNVSFDVRKGETVGIIGTNGSGKSTLLKIITGVLAASEGTVSVEGNISALLELGAGFNVEYTGRENIFLNGRMMGISNQDMQKREQAIIEFAEIGDFIDQPVKSYSSGMFARLAFAVAINVEPDILIVDEALSVGDLFFQNKCFHKFDELKAKGVTILFVSHDISSVRQMCSRVLWLDKGVARAFGDANTICDMYMDEKRKGEQYVAMHIHEEINNGDMQVRQLDEEAKYPVLPRVEDRFQNTQVAIRSVFFTEEHGEYANTVYVDHNYTAHVVVECLTDTHDLIVGFILENNKGLPLYDINNFINQSQVIHGKQGQILEVSYHFKLPRIMNGMYLVSAAIGQGTQAHHEMLTWLHGVRELEIINQGYNSSYIEIPANIEVTSNKKENVIFC